MRAPYLRASRRAIEPRRRDLGCVVDAVAIGTQDTALRHFGFNCLPAHPIEHLADGQHLLLPASMVKIENSVILDSTSLATVLGFIARNCAANSHPSAQIDFSGTVRMPGSPPRGFFFLAHCSWANRLVRRTYFIRQNYLTPTATNRSLEDRLSATDTVIWLRTHGKILPSPLAP